MSNNPDPYYQRPLKPFKPIPPRRPDALEYVLRFVFGFVIGFFLGFYVFFKIMYYGDTQSIMAFAFIFAGVFGLLSMIVGDQFWKILKFWEYW